MRLGEHEVAEARAVIRRALDEDLRYGPDVTTEATVPADATTTAALVAREGGVIAGVDVALLVLDEVLGMGGYRVLQRLSDGDRLERYVIALRVEGDTRGLLTAERTMLNLVCHLSGIATATRQWVDAVAGTRAIVRDTRKTLPGLRALQKYAVRVGRRPEPPDGTRRRRADQGQPRRRRGLGGRGASRRQGRRARTAV